ncbi:MAG: hypothetical protein K0R46_619 [Herbinix sp.]|jgi:hypothetical protein|nr:hypothetical protein [Herbinix sp.]
MIRKYYKDQVFTFEGCISVEERGTLVSPWRLNHERLGFYPFLEEVGHQCSGVRLCFTTNSPEIYFRIASHEYDLKFDLWIDGKQASNYKLKQKETCFSYIDGLQTWKKVELWMDQGQIIWVDSVEIAENAVIKKTEDHRTKWVHYGSSISHSHQAISPSDIWTGIVAREKNWHLTNLGFSGNCKIEPMMGMLIGRLPADIITLKLGINVSRGELTPRTFAPNVIGLIQIIRESKPKTPIVLISPIYSPPREEKGNIESNINLKEMRRILEEIVTICVSYGDENIYYLDGLKLFGTEELRYLPDELHPNAEGQQVLAEHFIRELVINKPC